MAYDLPCVSYMALYMISTHILSSNSRSSVGANHWRLNVEEGKVVQAEDDISAGKAEKGTYGDPLFSILTNKRLEGDEWRVDSNIECKGCIRKELTEDIPATNTNSSFEWSEGKNSNKSSDHQHKERKPLTCGKSVNYTQYDHLRGIADRNEHGHSPEPEVAMVFRKKGDKSSQIDMNDLECRLRKIKKQKPKSAETFNQIGNFWRIKGNPQYSIECFRKALHLSPNDPDILLNLARVLFNLQYLDDAILLTRRSLVMQSTQTWLQHFTLGEILKAYGHYSEASQHLRHALDLNPGYQPAQAHLREMEGTPNPSITQYTLFIILFLVMGVVFGVITSIEANYDDGAEGKPQRHFNRAMAMRSIKLGINPRLIRLRKAANC